MVCDSYGWGSTVPGQVDARSCLQKTRPHCRAELRIVQWSKTRSHRESLPRAGKFWQKGECQSRTCNNIILRERLPRERSKPEYRSDDQYQADLMHTVLSRTQARTRQDWDCTVEWNPIPQGKGDPVRAEPEYCSGDQNQAELMCAVICRTQVHTWLCSEFSVGV